MKGWLSQMITGNTNHASDVNYLPWVASIPSDYQIITCFVSHLDWDHAQRIIASSLAQDRQMAEEGTLGRPNSTIDVRAWIGALYQCSLAHNDGGFHVGSVNDIDNFTWIKDHFGPSRSGGFCSMRLPKVTPTPAMVEIRNALQVAHPTCCQKLGPQILDWYSASIVLLGIPDSVDHSNWKCKHCVQCKAATKCHKSAPLPDTAKQQVFDAKIRELAEFAANQGLKFDIPAVDVNEQASRSNESESTNNDDTSDSEVLGRDNNTRHDRCVYLSGNTFVALLLLSPNCEVHTSARTVAVHQPKPMRIPKSFMVHEIKDHLTKLLGTPPSYVTAQKNFKAKHL